MRDHPLEKSGMFSCAWLINYAQVSGGAPNMNGSDKTEAPAKGLPGEDPMAVR